MVFCQRLFDFQGPATFANMPATFQRLSGNSRKNPGIPGKIGEKSKFLGKNGQKTGKMGYFPNFQEKSGMGPAVSGAAHIGPKWPILGPFSVCWYRDTETRKRVPGAALQRRRRRPSD